MRLRDRAALVTGASRGIGRAIAIAFASEGARVWLGARDLKALEALEEEIRTAGGEASAVALDVTDQASVDACRRAAGAVDVLVNNAGIAGSVKLVKMDDAHWQSHLDVNLTGPFRMTRAFLPAMLERGWGRIINIASTAGKVGFQYTAAYCASKHGLVGLTRAVALETATEGVTVNAICPGFVRTDMAAEAARNIATKTKKSEAEARQWLENLSPQKRMIEPAEVAALAVLLASEEARGIHGQAINVDGGAVVY